MSGNDGEHTGKITDEQAKGERAHELAAHDHEAHVRHGAIEFDRQVELMGDALGTILRVRNALETMPRSREASLAITKLDEAWMWAQNIPVEPREEPVQPE